MYEAARRPLPKRNGSYLSHGAVGRIALAIAPTIPKTPNFLRRVCSEETRKNRLFGLSIFLNTGTCSVPIKALSSEDGDAVVYLLKGIVAVERKRKATAFSSM